MTSGERKEVRYQRRKSKRINKKIEMIKSLGTFEDIFTYNNLYESFRYCKSGVRWKASIQSYEANLPINTFNLYSKLNKGTWKSKGFTKFNICERGKMRTIQSVHISERCIQRTFCDNYLVPVTMPSLIYDNGASLKNKGIDFAINRLKHHLLKHYNKYGNEGYIITIDFSNYFGNISHDVLFDQMDKLFIDERLKDLYHKLIDAFTNGIGLGSQVSQISAVAFANKIDHYFKDKLGIKGYARYMDDGYIISENLNNIKTYKDELIRIANELDLDINNKKIKIIKLSHSFTWLKHKFALTESGKVYVRLINKSFVKMRTKINKLDNIIPYKDIESSYKSWRGNAIKYSNYFQIKRLDCLYNEKYINTFEKGNNYELFGTY